LPEPGLDGIAPERAVYPLTFHDARSVNSDRLTTFFEAKWVFGSGRMADFQVLVLFFWIYGDLWLVVSNMFYIFFHHIWEWKIIPTDDSPRQIFGLLSPKKGRKAEIGITKIQQLMKSFSMFYYPLPLLCFLVMLGASYCLVNRNGLARDFRPREFLTIWLVVSQCFTYPLVMADIAMV
jgi:hypothetical protein